jgi:hypothetical protein
MTVVVAVWVTADFADLQRMHVERRLLRLNYGCNNTRLVQDQADPGRVLVLMEFPSMLHAKSYLSASTLSLGSDAAKVTDRTLEFFEDVSLNAAAAAAIAAS